MELKLAIETVGLGLWGAGRESFRADVVTFTLRAGGVDVPVIPGSYVKGLIRGWAYRLLPLLVEKGIVSAAVPQGCTSSATCGECIVCKAFGYQGGPPSPLSATNFYPVKRDALERAAELMPDDLILEMPDAVAEARPAVTYVPHVRIEDSSGKAAEGGLFFCEAVAPGSVFYGCIRLNEGALESLGGSVVAACRLILLSLAQLNFSYAGRRSRIAVKVLRHDLGQASGDEVCRKVVAHLGGGGRG